MKQIAIIIVNYNARDVLLPCLQSLHEQTWPHELDIWVVDNASSDGSAQAIAERFADVHLIAHDQNVGFSAGNNLALRQILAAETQPDAVLLLNPDTWVPTEGITRLVEALATRPQAGAVGPKLLLEDGTLDAACRRSFPTAEVALYRMTGLSKMFPNSKRFGRYNLSYLDPNQATEVDSLVGAAMLVRRSVIEEVGLLDETFFMYGEDIDWCYRIKSYGWQIWYDPAAVIRHYKRVSSTRRAVPSIKAFYEAMRIFHRKHFAEHTWAPINWLIYLGIRLKEWQALLRNRLLPTRNNRMA